MMMDTHNTLGGIAVNNPTAYTPNAIVEKYARSQGLWNAATGANGVVADNRARWNFANDQLAAQDLLVRSVRSYERHKFSKMLGTALAITFFVKAVYNQISYILGSEYKDAFDVLYAQLSLLVVASLAYLCCYCCTCCSRFIYVCLVDLAACLGLHRYSM